VPLTTAEPKEPHRHDKSAPNVSTRRGSA
jgi:hypothetical protein